MYTREIDQMTPAEIWLAWKKQLLTIGQVAEWQSRHKIYFNEEGNTTT